MMTKASTQLFLGCLLLGLSFMVCKAENWVLANGDRLTGELVAETPAYLEIKHPQLGLLKVPREALKAADPKKAARPEPEAVELAVTTEVKTALKPEASPWKRQLEFGYSQQSGAKEKQDLSLRLQLDGKRGANTFRSTAKLLQSEVDGVTGTDRREADFRWRYDINKRLFTQALTNYAEDSVRKIDLSLEQQVGGGYRLVDTPRHKVNVGLGAVLQYLDRVGTANQMAFLGSFFQDYAYQLNSRVKLMQESTFMISDTGTLNVRNGVANAPAEGSYRLKFNTGLQSKVTDRMSLNLRFDYDYDRSILESGLRADQRLTTSLGYIW
jgi:putative salt-induced outer membrane protein YdiY